VDSIPRMPATLAELEARVAALEAERADYRAVLAAVNLLGENQREHAARLERVESQLERMETKLDGMNSRVRSIEENLAEFKGLLVRALDG
jgi:chromosome segregation ATPase